MVVIVVIIVPHSSIPYYPKVSNVALRAPNYEWELWYFP